MFLEFLMGKAATSSARPGACPHSTFRLAETPATCSRTVTPDSSGNSSTAPWVVRTPVATRRASSAWVHCGYETTANDFTFSSIRGFGARSAPCSVRRTSIPRRRRCSPAEARQAPRPRSCSSGIDIPRSTGASCSRSAPLEAAPAQATSPIRRLHPDVASGRSPSLSPSARNADANPRHSARSAHASGKMYWTITRGRFSLPVQPDDHRQCAPSDYPIDVPILQPRNIFPRRSRRLAVANGPS